MGNGQRMEASLTSTGTRSAWTRQRRTSGSHTPVRAVLFDIGGVLEATPPLGILEEWERQLGLESGEIAMRLFDVFEAGSLGTISERDVYSSVRARLRLDEAQVDAFMDDIWTEYLGTLNVGLVEYFRRLRPRFRTGIISNSFVGARRKEQALYGFEDMTDLIIYSHEAGMSKPDPRIYTLACDHLDVLPEQAIFLDDSETAVDGAQKVGMRAVVFRDNAQAIADVEAHLV